MAKQNKFYRHLPAKTGTQTHSFSGKGQFSVCAASRTGVIPELWKHRNTI